MTIFTSHPDAIEHSLNANSVLIRLLCCFEGKKLDAYETRRFNEGVDFMNAQHPTFEPLFERKA